MPRPDRNVYLTFLDNYAQTGNTACPQHAAASSWARWTVRTTAFIVAECPCGCSCRQQPHNHALPDRCALQQDDIEGKLGSVAMPLRPEETLYTRRDLRFCMDTSAY